MRKIATLLLVMGVALGLAGCAANQAASPTTTNPNYHPTIVVEWNELMLAAIRSGAPKPTIVTRQMFIVHTAIYDAWSRYDEAAQPVYLTLDRRPAGEHNLRNQEEAISYAAYDTLTYLFPAYEADTGDFTEQMKALGYDPVRRSTPHSPADIGRRAAAAAIEARYEDGANAAGDYAEITSDQFPELYQPAADNQNHWQPLLVPNGQAVNEFGHPIVDLDNPDSYSVQSFLTPHWGAVEPFALQVGGQFRPPPPPRLGDMRPYTDALGQTMSNDEAFRQQFTAVLEYSGQLTDEQKVIAEYWADGPRSETPPGHWNALAHGLAYRDQHTLAQDVKMFMVLNCALLDGGIAAWDAKRTYDFIRPQTAIRMLYAGQMVEAWGGPDQGTQLIPGEMWQPYQDLKFVTPPFPEYVSGHSVFSAAAAEVLASFTGSEQFYDGQTTLPEDFNGDGEPDYLGQHIVYPGGNMFESSPSEVVMLRWPTLKDAANEAGISRLYGGIHIQDGDLRGRELGQRIGALSYEQALRLWGDE